MLRRNLGKSNLSPETTIEHDHVKKSSPPSIAYLPEIVSVERLRGNETCSFNARQVLKCCRAEITC